MQQRKALDIGFLFVCRHPGWNPGKRGEGLKREMLIVNDSIFEWVRVVMKDTNRRFTELGYSRVM